MKYRRIIRGDRKKFTTVRFCEIINIKTKLLNKGNEEIRSLEMFISQG